MKKAESEMKRSGIELGNCRIIENTSLFWVQEAFFNVFVSKIFTKSNHFGLQMAYLIHSCPKYSQNEEILAPDGSFEPFMPKIFAK